MIRKSRIIHPRSGDGQQTVAGGADPPDDTRSFFDRNPPLYGLLAASPAVIGSPRYCCAMHRCSSGAALSRASASQRRD